MKHLFIIDPASKHFSDGIDEIEKDIHNYFAANPRRNYAVHFCRWKRDASGYTQRYVSNALEMVRVYAMGGSNTLFEVINGAVGLPNVQIAWYPLGKVNPMLYAFGGDRNLSFFQSLQNLSLSPVITMDTIRAGNHYIATNAFIGAEAKACRAGEDLADRAKLPKNVCCFTVGLLNALLGRDNQFYSMETEHEKAEGEYNTILVSNAPTGGTGLKSAAEALLNDGYMDVYAIKRIPRTKVFAVVRDYGRGLYRNWPQYITHYRCKEFRISSASVMTISLDESFFYSNAMDFEICPYSLDFVCPAGLSIPTIPMEDTAEPEENFTIEDFTGSTNSGEVSK
jgi:diacylglycerol kinase family enzyme